MEIFTQRTPRGVELFVKGRLDAYWADHLTKSLDEVIRGGSDHISLNLREVVYLSSAGIRVLIHLHKQLKGIQGMLVITDPSEQVTTVLKVAGLDALLLTQPVNEPVSHVSPSRQVKQGHTVLEVFHETPQGSLTCQMVGNPDQLLRGGFTEADTQSLLFPKSTFAIGLGAIGENFEQCRVRFGEFLAAEGAAAYLPTDGTNVPDYSVAQGMFIPSLRVLYALKCTGNFSHLVRFEPAQDHSPIPLMGLVDSCLDIVSADLIGLVMVAESAGLIGASLKRSPAHDGHTTNIFHHPGIRDWLSFTPERVHARGLTLVVGVAAHGTAGTLSSFLRPLGPGASPIGHFHAATFSYQPLKRGILDLATTVTTLFEAERLQGLLHLLSDHREINGTGQSEFIRGACWISPVQDIIGTGA